MKSNGSRRMKIANIRVEAITAGEGQHPFPTFDHAIILGADGHELTSCEYVGGSIACDPVVVLTEITAHVFMQKDSAAFVVATAKLPEYFGARDTPRDIVVYVYILGSRVSISVSDRTRRAVATEASTSTAPASSEATPSVAPTEAAPSVAPSVAPSEAAPSVAPSEAAPSVAPVSA